MFQKARRMSSRRAELETDEEELIVHNVPRQPTTMITTAPAGVIVYQGTSTPSTINADNDDDDEASDNSTSTSTYSIEDLPRNVILRAFTLQETKVTAAECGHDGRGEVFVIKDDDDTYV
jgi:hypothetical protein